MPYLTDFNAAITKLKKDAGDHKASEFFLVAVRADAKPKAAATALDAAKTAGAMKGAVTAFGTARDVYVKAVGVAMGKDKVAATIKPFVAKMAQALENIEEEAAGAMATLSKTESEEGPKFETLKEVGPLRPVVVTPNAVPQNLEDAKLKALVKKAQLHLAGRRTLHLNTALEWSTKVTTGVAKVEQLTTMVAKSLSEALVAKKANNLKLVAGCATQAKTAAESAKTQAAALRNGLKDAMDPFFKDRSLKYLSYADGSIEGIKLPAEVEKDFNAFVHTMEPRFSKAVATGLASLASLDTCDRQVEAAEQTAKEIGLLSTGNPGDFLKSAAAGVAKDLKEVQVLVENALSESTSTSNVDGAQSTLADLGGKDEERKESAKTIVQARINSLALSITKIENNYALIRSIVVGHVTRMPDDLRQNPAIKGNLDEMTSLALKAKTPGDLKVKTCKELIAKLEAASK